MKFYGIVAAALFARFIRQAEADVCLMVYQMADNNLEGSMRDDNWELIKSPAIRNKTLTTWVYFDSRNYGTDGEDIKKPLRDVYNPDGTPLTEKSQNSLYMTWDHSQDKMIVNWTSPMELNSDTPQIVQDFVVTAMTDCLSKGSTEYMMILSSHGAGMWGFGGDDNTKRRRLIQSNFKVITALQSAITNISDSGVYEYVPEQFDVIGFDACLMQSVDAVDDYRNITKYYLASEATEPGHGWAYKYLDTAESALAMAKNLQKNYIEQSQVFGFLGEWLDIHLTPKTLAIVDTSLFTDFLEAWDALCSEFTSLLEKDTDFFTHLYRARNSAIAFQGVPDDASSKTPSAVDVGSFMTQLRVLCGPAEGSNLISLLSKAEATYATMFVVRGVGVGTPNATGMHITWPQRRLYDSDIHEFLYESLFNTSLPLATDDAPNFLGFLSTYYEASSPIDNGEPSVCTLTAGEEVEGLFLIDPKVVVGESYVDIMTNISRTVDEVVIQYGIDVTPLLQQGSRYRRLQRIAEKSRSESATEQPIMNRAHRRTRNLISRRLPFDYFVIFGGDVAGTFSSNSYAGKWNKTFCVLGDVNSVESVYAIDYGDGYRSVPVIYYPFEIEREKIEIGTTIDEAVKLGGTIGFITFSGKEGEEISASGLALYTYGEGSTSTGTGTGTNTLSETPRSAGGSIVPIVFTEAVIEDTLITELVGGFNSTVVPWNNQSEIGVVIVNAVEYLQDLELEQIIIYIAAFDDDNNAAANDSYADEVFTTNITLDQFLGRGSPGKKSAAAKPSAFFASALFVLLTNFLWS